MASLRSFFIKQYIRSARDTILFRKHHTDILKMRRGFELLGSRHLLPKNIYFKRIFIDHIPAAWIIPQHAQSDKVMLYLHGGGYAVGSVNTHKSLIAKIAKKADIQALGIDYRLAPEHPFPAAIEDAVRAYRYLLEQGYKPENLIIAGDSAGGGLTLATLITLRNTGIPLPAMGVCLSPWTDLAVTGASVTERAHLDPMIVGHLLSEWAKRYAGDTPTNHPLISPLYADLHGLPPLLIQVGSDEVIHDDSVRFAQKAKEQGTEVTLDVWDSMIHVWQFLWFVLPEANDAIKEIARFIKTKLGKAEAKATV
ncbi:MAG TPA: alpha/beta hydrolase [Chitinophagales bacterium]|nr:alpha/beta hydrolase [Chitinophagales bacterium]HRK26215.1 alpha/beta hydrolase [Chitinophagales bacterium]